MYIWAHSQLSWTHKHTYTQSRVLCSTLGQETTKNLPTLTQQRGLSFFLPLSLSFSLFLTSSLSFPPLSPFSLSPSLTLFSSCSFSIYLAISYFRLDESLFRIRLFIYFLSEMGIIVYLHQRRKAWRSKKNKKKQTNLFFRFEALVYSGIVSLPFSYSFFFLFFFHCFEKKVKKKGKKRAEKERKHYTNQGKRRLPKTKKSNKKQKEWRKKVRMSRCTCAGVTCICIGVRM